MALTINETKGDDMSKVTVDRRLWLAADRETLVEDGDPRATFLWAAAAGREVPADEAERVGYAPASGESAQDETDHPEPEPDVEPLPDGHVACPIDGCDYSGTRRGLKIHTGQVHDSEDD